MRSAPEIDALTGTITGCLTLLDRNPHAWSLIMTQPDHSDDQASYHRFPCAFNLSGPRARQSGCRRAVTREVRGRQYFVAERTLPRLQRVTWEPT